MLESRDVSAAARRPAAAAERRVLSTTRILIVLLLIAVSPGSALCQGVAVVGRQARPKRPLPAGMTAPTVRFRDIGSRAGLVGDNVSGAPQDKTYIVESTGTGVAVLDFDRDGLQDIFFPNADRLDGKGPRPQHYLYRNRGNLEFEDVTAAAGILHTGWAQGACIGDVDDDGYDDIFISQWGPHVLYRNNRDGTFVDESKKRGFDEGERRWSTGCAFFDFDRDGDLDLVVANYMDFDPAKTPKPGESPECEWQGIPVLCGPRGLPAESMSLYENSGGVFTDATASSGIATKPHYYCFTPLASDFDGDGWIDVYVACDSTASLLFHNRRDGTFAEIGVSSGTAYNEDGQEQAGMGVAAADFDGDGDLDLFKTNFSQDTHTLYRNEGDMFFNDDTVAAGLAVNTRYVGWGAVFLDIDHDGWKDLFVANGHVYPSVDQAGIGETFRQQRLVYWNRGDGSFHDLSGDAGPAIVEAHSSRGVATADFDNDGDLEIVVVNLHEPPSLLENSAPSGGSILVEALAPSGRPSLGARVRVTAGGRAQIDEIRSGGSFLSHNDARLHFGVGDARKLSVEIRWPDGSTDRFDDVDADHWISIRQGRGIEKSLELKK